jgi:thiamine pyrophosphokinase
MATVDNMQLWPLKDIIAKQEVVPIPSRMFLLAATIILNVPMTQHDILRSILSKSQLSICADGGSNVLYDETRLEGSADDEVALLPDIVIGDLDSIRDDVRSFYDSKNVEIVKVEDQDSTDLDKALAYAAAAWSGSESSFAVIIGSIGAHEGRIDQFFAVINSMYKYRSSYPRLVQIGKESIMLVLDKGSHRIELPLAAIDRHCGLVPIFGGVKEVTTSGLEWNLDPSMGPLGFGSLMSTNNILRASTVIIETSEPLLFTITYRD